MTLNPTLQFVTRVLLLLVLLGGAIYVGSYYCLSRRGIREAKQYKMEIFYYVPVKEMWGAFPESAYRRHSRLRRFYHPLNVIDSTLFGGLTPERGSIRRLVE